MISFETTPQKTNMESENEPLEEEIPIRNHHFQVPCQFSGVYRIVLAVFFLPGMRKVCITGCLGTRWWELGPQELRIHTPEMQPPQAIPPIPNCERIPFIYSLLVKVWGIVFQRCVETTLREVHQIVQSS